MVGEGSNSRATMRAASAKSSSIGIRTGLGSVTASSPESSDVGWRAATS
jgi:hypothetical protein